MALMTRTRTRGAAPAPVTTGRTRPAPAEAPQRKLMRASKAAPSEVVKEAQKKIIANKLQLIAMDYEKIERLQKRIQGEVDECRASIKRQEADIQEALKKSGMEGYTDGKWEALFEHQISRSTRVFDNNAVYKRLSLKDFLSVVKVQATEVKSVMNEREIEEVSEVIPGEKKPDIFVVRKVPEKKAK